MRKSLKAFLIDRDEKINGDYVINSLSSVLGKYKNMNPNLLALIVAAIWGLAPIFEKMSLKELNPMFVLFVRFVLVTCLKSSFLSYIK